MEAENKIFIITFAISAATHSFILSQNPGLILFSQNKKEQKIEINYIKQVKINRQHTTTIDKREPLKELPSKITMRKLPPPPFIEKEDALKKNDEMNVPKPNLIKPQFNKPDALALKKRITLPALEIGKINNPTYMNYYQLVREKIRRSAYQNYNRSETGEVYLSFIISSGGELKNIQLIEEKSSRDSYLKDVAIRSLKNASPFPAFPKELDYPQLSLNVIISFEIE